MQFAVRTLDSRGTADTVLVDAVDAAMARAEIESAGRAVVSVKRAAVWRTADAFPLALFTRELLALLTAGLSLTDALSGLAERQRGNPAERRIVEGLLTDIERGRTLAQALAARPSAFPPIYVASVEASQTTGSIAPALARYLSYRATVDAVRQKLVTASIYPALLLAVGSAIVLFLLLYVVPRFALVYADRNVDALPFLARALLDWGEFVGRYAAWFVAGLVGLAVLAVAGLRSGRLQSGVLTLLGTSSRFRAFRDLFSLSRFYRTNGMLMAGGHSLLDAIRMSLPMLPGAARARMQGAAARIAEGVVPSVALDEAGLASPIALRLIAAGERSGNLPEMLQHLADFHDAELMQVVDVFLRLFEPILMLLIGGVIGTIIVLMYLPIFELVGSI